MSQLRSIPSVDKLVQAVIAADELAELPRELIVQAARTTLDERRAALRQHPTPNTQHPTCPALLPRSRPAWPR